MKKAIALLLLFFSCSSWADYEYYVNDDLGQPVTIYPGNATKNNLVGPGEYFDEETGLIYNGQRFIDPKTGRYVSQDPLGLGAGDPNLYRHLNNNPNKFIDPDGMRSISHQGFGPPPGFTPAPQWPGVLWTPAHEPGPMVHTTPDDLQRGVILINTPAPPSQRFHTKGGEPCPPNTQDKIRRQNAILISLLNKGRRIIGRPQIVPTGNLYPEPGGDYDIRPGFDEDAVGRRKKEISGGNFEPISVIETPQGYMISDGLHRWEAARRMNRPTVPVTVIGREK